MNAWIGRLGLLAAGVGLGALVANLPAAAAKSADTQVDPSQKRFIVSIDEIRKNFVFGREFLGRYETTIALSDGSSRHVTLTPMLRDGKQVVALDDNGVRTYMGWNGTTTNGHLMIQVNDVDTQLALARAAGFDFPDR